MIEHVSNVFLCSSMEDAPLGWAEKEPIKFELQLTATGEGEERLSNSLELSRKCGLG